MLRSCMTKDSGCEDKKCGLHSRAERGGEARGGGEGEYREESVFDFNIQEKSRFLASLGTTISLSQRICGFTFDLRGERWCGREELNLHDLSATRS